MFSVCVGGLVCSKGSSSQGSPSAGPSSCGSACSSCPTSSSMCSSCTPPPSGSPRPSSLASGQYGSSSVTSKVKSTLNGWSIDKSPPLNSTWLIVPETIMSLPGTMSAHSFLTLIFEGGAPVSNSLPKTAVSDPQTSLTSSSGLLGVGGIGPFAASAASFSNSTSSCAPADAAESKNNSSTVTIAVSPINLRRIAVHNAWHPSR